MSAPTLARMFGRSVQHLISKADSAKTECGLDTRRMARFSPSDLPSGERTAPLCENCRSKR